MAGNLKAIEFQNGDMMQNVSDMVAWTGLTQAAYCNYNNDENNVDEHGRLYNWHAASDSRNIAPVGWHVPTDEEWKILEQYLGMTQAQADAQDWRGTTEGQKLKQTGILDWGGTNESGFSALPSGYRLDTDGTFLQMGIFTHFWTASDLWARGLGLTAQINRDNNNYQYGFSIRCVKNVDAEIAISSPNGGETWEVGSQQTITWSSSGTSGTVDIEYSTDNGATWLSQESNVTDNGSYPWTVPDAPSTTCLVKVSDLDGSPVDQSDAVFAIYSDNFSGSSGVFLDNRDSACYNWVLIGNQVWMAENLKTVKYQNGDSLQTIIDNNEWIGLQSGAAGIYANDENNLHTYGRLYNWYAVNDNRNIAPAGWHVPTDAEWKQLELYLGMSPSEVDGVDNRGFDESDDLKAESGWYEDGNGTNSSGFTGLPSGYREYDNGTFQSLTLNGFFWTASELENSSAWHRDLDYNTSLIARNGYNKGYGFSIRCVKGTSPGENYYWIGGSGNWDDRNHWSAYSGGPGGIGVPDSSHSAIFDENSFPESDATVTINIDAICHDMDWTGVTNNPTLAGDTDLFIYGSLTLVPDMSFTYYGGTYMRSWSMDETLTMAGHQINANLMFDGPGGWTLQDELHVVYWIHHIRGTLNTNSHSIICEKFNGDYSHPRMLSLGASVITCTINNDCAWIMPGTDLTLDAGTSIIDITGTNASLRIAGNQTLHNIEFSNTSSTSELRFSGTGVVAHDVTFYGNGRITEDDGYGTITNLTLSAGYDYSFDSGQALIVGGVFTATGTNSEKISIHSDVQGTQAIIVKTSGIVDAHYVQLEDMSATGGATFNAYNSDNISNNSGWNFIDDITLPFTDDFSDGNYDGWTVVGGNWDAGSGALLSTGSPTTTHPWIGIAFGNTSWSNYSVDFDWSYGSGSVSNGSVWFRVEDESPSADDPANGYRLQIVDQGDLLFSLRKRVDGQEYGLGGDAIPAGLSLKHVRIEVSEYSQGTLIRAYLNDDLLIQYCDTDEGRPLYGGIFIQNYDQSLNQTFDNFDVREFNPLLPFADDFSDGDYFGWQVTGGTWSAVSTALTTTGGDINHAVIGCSCGHPDWTDYRLTCDWSYGPASKSEGSIWIRVQDEESPKLGQSDCNKGYRIQIDDSETNYHNYSLRKWWDGTEYNLLSGDIPLGLVNKHIDIQVIDVSEGTRIVLSVNGTEWFDYLDTDVNRPAYGGFYLDGAWIRVQDQIWDNFQVESISEEKSDVVAYYQFNGDAQDISGSDNHGTVTGAVYGPDRFLAANKSIIFDGNDHVVVPDAPSLDFSMTKAFTISFFCKVSDTGIHQFLVGKWGESLYQDDDWLVELRTDGKISFYVSATSLSELNTQLTSNSAVLYDTWTHLSLVCDANNSFMGIYLDGTLDNSTNSAQNTIAHTSEELRIGGGLNSEGWVHGAIDDIRIYNRKLTETEIEALYLEGGYEPAGQLSGTLNSGTGPIEDGTVELWDDYPDGSIIAQETSGVDGNFAITSAPEGMYDLRCYAAGYFPNVVEGVNLPSEGNHVLLTEISSVTSTSKVCDFWGISSTMYELPLRPGDVVTAKGPENVQCGAFQVTVDGAYSIHVYGDDPTTADIDEGPVSGDGIRFYVNQLPAEIVSGSNIWQELGSINTELAAPVQACEILLQPNWNLVSFNVSLDDSSVAAFVAPLGEDIRNIFGYVNGGFQTWDAVRPSFLNDLEYLNSRQGYWVRLEAATPETLIVNGDPCSVSSPIPLDTDWNLISYLPSQSDSISNAFSSLADQYQMIFGYENGGFKTWDRARPAFLNDLMLLKSSLGYWVKMLSPGTLVYPAIPVHSGSMSIDQWTDPYLESDNESGTPYCCDIWGIDAMLSAGDIVEVCGEHGELYGTGTVEKEGGFLVHVRGDDPLTNAVEGAYTGEKLTLKVNGIGVETASPVEWSDKLSLQVNLISFVTQPQTRINFKMHQNYPNPFNPETTITYEVPEACKVRVAIYNLRGEQIKVLTDRMHSAGTHQVVWRGEDDNNNPVSSGVFLVIMRFNNTSLTRKITYLK